MLKPVSYKTDEHRAYQQALDDFGITELLGKLNNYSDADFDSAWIQPQQQEIETLAAILISQLTHSINGKLIAAYLNLIRHSHQDIVPGLINLKYSDASIELPANFPDIAKTPRFLYGDRCVGFLLKAILTGVLSLVDFIVLQAIAAAGVGAT